MTDNVNLCRFCGFPADEIEIEYESERQVWYRCGRCHFNWAKRTESVEEREP